MIGQFSRFAFIGAMVAGVQLLSFSIFHHLFDSTFLPFTVSYVLSIFCHFICNRRLAFAMRGKPRLGEVKRYLIMVVANYVVSTAVFYSLIYRVSPQVSLLIAIGTTTLLGFALSRNWVFRSTAV